MSPVARFFEFGPFRLDTDERKLLRQGETVPLTPKAYDTLLALVQRPGQIVEKADLMRMVWPDTVVEENNLNQTVSAVRKALAAQSAELIETVPRRGYRFRGGVDAVPEEGGVVVAERRRTTVTVEREEEIENVEPAAPSSGQRRRSPLVV